MPLISPFNSFPVATPSGITVLRTGAPANATSFNSFPVATRGWAACGCSGASCLSILSQLLLMVHSYPDLRRPRLPAGFQFFPSCYLKRLPKLRLPRRTFNSFPVATGVVRVIDLVSALVFQFFPSCYRSGAARPCRRRALHHSLSLSILSQLLPSPWLVASL